MNQFVILFVHPRSLFSKKWNWYEREAGQTGNLEKQGARFLPLPGPSFTEQAEDSLSTLLCRGTAELGGGPSRLFFLFHYGLRFFRSDKKGCFWRLQGSLPSGDLETTCLLFLLVYRELRLPTIR